MSVTLRKRKNSDGSHSLRLDIYHEGKRYYESLKNLRIVKPVCSKDRQDNKELLRIAETIRLTRAKELDANCYNLESEVYKNVPVVEWMHQYVKTYTKSDIRNIEGALNRFKDFLKQKNLQGVKFSQLNELLIEEFIEYLEKRSIGEGASSYFSRFKKMLKYAYRKKILKTNILDLVERKVKGKAAKKDILTLQEIEQLTKTHVESSVIRRAAIFSLMTGMAWVDIKNLKWESIDLYNKRIFHKQRSKTEEEIITPLNQTAIRVLNVEPRTNGFVFDLPSANGANKTLKNWVKRAGINKKITWHNLRHSAGTNLAYNGFDILTISKILAHASIKHTQRYVDAAEEMKIKATDVLNFDVEI